MSLIENKIYCGVQQELQLGQEIFLYLNSYTIWNKEMWVIKKTGNYISWNECIFTDLWFVEF